MYPRGFERLRTSMGYRLRPSWVWQRKRYGTSELIVCISNRGVAGVPGVLWLQLESPDQKLNLRGALDAGHPHGGGIRQASFLLPEGYSGKVQSFGPARDSSGGEKAGGLGMRTAGQP